MVSSFVYKGGIAFPLYTGAIDFPVFTGALTLCFMGGEAVLPNDPPSLLPVYARYRPFPLNARHQRSPVNGADRFPPYRPVTGFLVYTRYRFCLYTPVISAVFRLHS